MFLALDLDPVARAAAAEVQRVARAAAGFRVVAVRWVRPENLHLTLAFLGELDTDRAARVSRAAADPWLHSPFRVELASAEVVPLSGPPRTVWLPVSTGSRELARLHADVCARLGSVAAAPADPRLRGHVTLGRVRRVPRVGGRRVREALARLPAPVLGWKADAVALYESRLTPDGASYRLVERAPLRCVILKGGP